MENPFVFHRPLSADDLIDRESELEVLLARLEGGVNTRLSAPRDFGKTSLLKRVLFDCVQQDIVSVFIDLDGVRTKTDLAARLQDSYEQLAGRARRILGALRRRGGTLTIGGFGGAIGGRTADEVELDRLILELLDFPETLYQREDRRVAVVFDEFQTVLESDLDGLIRSVIQHHGANVTYVFSGSHPGMMNALFADRNRPFYGQAAPLVLKGLPDLDLSDFIANAFEKTGRDAGEPLHWLIELVDGHPQRAMLLSHLLWEETSPSATAGEDEWYKTLEVAWQYLKEPFQTHWNSLSSIQRGTLQAIAANRAGLTAGASRVEFGLPAGSAASQAAKHLEGDGVVIEDRSQPTGYHMIDPLFQLWIANRRRWPTNNTPNQPN